MDRAFVKRIEHSLRAQRTLVSFDVAVCGRERDRRRKRNRQSTDEGADYYSCRLPTLAGTVAEPGTRCDSLQCRAHVLCRKNRKTSSPADARRADACGSARAI